MSITVATVIELNQGKRLLWSRTILTTRANSGDAVGLTPSERLHTSCRLGVIKPHEIRLNWPMAIRSDTRLIPDAYVNHKKKSTWLIWLCHKDMLSITNTLRNEVASMRWSLYPSTATTFTSLSSTRTLFVHTNGEAHETTWGRQPGDKELMGLAYGKMLAHTHALVLKRVLCTSPG